MVYKHWTDTNRCVFYVEGETVAVGNNLIVGRGIGYQQTLGSELAAAGIDADPGAMYLTPVRDRDDLAVRRPGPSGR